MRLSLLVPLFPLLLLTSCGYSEKIKAAPVRVGLVFDVGGLGDKSFNDSAYAGLLRARDELGAWFEFIEPGDGSDRESALRQLAAEKFDIVIGVGFMFSDDIRRVALDFPGVSFCSIDYSGPAGSVPPNLAAVRFREDEGSFLAGALAGLVTKTGAVGFIGGMDIPLIHKFERGFAAGVRHVNPGCRLFTAYAGFSADAFKDPAKGRELAFSQYSSGADIIYHASGSTGLGVFEAARKSKNLAIGVDSDQWDEAPGFVLTSMLKRVDNVIFNTVRDRLNNSFSGGLRELGLAEDALGLVFNDKNRPLISQSARETVEAIRKEIIAGKIRSGI